jgi:hypothetical protein
LDEVKWVERYREVLTQDGRRTIVLAIVWALALAIGIGLNQLEIFLLSAPFSAGVFLLLPTRA